MADRVEASVRFAGLWLLRLSLVAFLYAGNGIASTAPQTSNVDSFQLRADGVIVYRTRPTSASIANSVAPTLWFAPSEQLRTGGEMVPTALPCDQSGSSGTVVYYRVEHWTNESDSEGGSRVRVRFYLYYPQDIAEVGCHSNDLETAAIDLDVIPAGDGTWRGFLVTVRGDAHGSFLFQNKLQFRNPNDPDESELPDTPTLPVTFLVEANKHAIAPDRGGDGMFRMGEDVNRRTRDAWGVRDFFWEQFSTSFRAYSPNMTQSRNPDDRVGPALNPSEQCPQGCGGPLGLADAMYQLREMPIDCLEGEVPEGPRPEPPCMHHRPLMSFLEEKKLRGSFVSDLWGEDGVTDLDVYFGSLDGLGIGLRFADMEWFDAGRGVMGLEIQVRRRDMRTINVESVEVQWFITRSASRVLEPYFATGVRLFPGGAPRGFMHLRGTTADGLVEGGLWLRAPSRIEVRFGVGTSLNDPLRFTTTISKHIVPGDL